MDLIELTTGNTRLAIAPGYGGRLAQIDIRNGDRWTPLLWRPEADRDLDVLGWGCYPMVPWPGRLANSRFSWQGRVVDVGANDGPHAIHGCGVFLPWSVEELSPVACRLSVSLAGWPFPARASHVIEVLDDGVRMRLEVEALGEDAFPAGLGWHPWLLRDVAAGHGPAVRVEADTVYEAGDGLIPTGELRAVSGDENLRGGPDLGRRRLDLCYRAVRGPIAVRWGELGLTLTSSPSVGHAVVFTPAHAFCVEPQTCAPDAFNLAERGIEGTGVQVVSPGHALVAETEWRWRMLPG